MQAAEEAAESSRRRRNTERAAIEKIKKGKQAKKKAKGKKRGSDEDESDEEYDDALAADMYRKAKPLPGQLDNCETCSKRFTVTPYSKTGPEGGFLCTPCGKLQTAEEKKQEKNTTKKGPVGRKRRKVESDRLDGLVTHGAKSLVDLCIDKIGQYHDSVEELGDLPEKLVDRLSMVYSKKRVLKSKTLSLFVRPDMRALTIHDAACTCICTASIGYHADLPLDLEVEDYELVFSTAQNIEKIVFRNACQFKDRTLLYMMEKASKIKHLQLYGANLVSTDMWIRFFQEYEPYLEAVQLAWLDASFDDNAVESIVVNHPSLQRLKLKRCRQITSAAIESIGRLPKLQHLSLQITHQDVTSELIVHLVENVGSQLKTLSLEHFIEADDEVLSTIHEQCQQLTKLRLSENECFTDSGFTALFDGWSNPPLTFVDLNSTRDVDNGNPEGPEEAVGLASSGFRALMAHSAEKLAHLNIASCRHISLGAFMDVFDGRKKYPELKEINISFCNAVDTVVIAGIFRSCPSIKKVVAFGCFNIADIEVPAGVVVIGVPKAQEAIEQFGNALMSMDEVMSAMGSVIGVTA